jgi:hypothetical protein
MAAMEEHLDRSNRGPAPPPEPVPERRPRARDLALGSVVAVLFAAAIVVAAILSFDWNPVGPVVVTVAAIVGGSLAVRRVEDYALKGAAVGLVVGGIAAILLWPFFDVS